MHYSYEYLREYLPRNDPERSAVPDAVDREIDDWLKRSQDDSANLEARSTRWTYAIFSEIALRQFDISFFHGIPPVQVYEAILGKRPLAVGLFDPDSEEKGFGLIAHLPLRFDPADEPASFWIAGEIKFPNLNANFKLAVRRAWIEDHNLAHPTNATAAANVLCRSSGDWGILTAGHAVAGIQIGSSISLEGGIQGKLRRHFHPPIDAAFIGGLSRHSPSGFLPIRTFPAAGSPVTVETKGGSQARAVVHVDSAMGVVNTRSYPVQLFLDQPCLPGDSGALVRTSTGEASGIYLGSLKTPTVPSGLAGRALNFEQATLALDVTAYI